MKLGFPVAIVLLLGCVIGCSQLGQRSQNPPQNNPATAQSSPFAAVERSATAKSSGPRGTPAEAKAMLEKAIEHYNSVGRKQALADFNSKKPPFVDRDLYVFCIDQNRMILANGGFPQYVGTSNDAWKDADGKPLGQAILDAAKNSADGSLKYHWINPVSHGMEPKIAFVQKVGDDVCGVGAYNPE